MIDDDKILIELCKEVITEGVNTTRFTELWIQSGVALNDVELEIANRLLSYAPHSLHSHEPYLH